MKDKIKILEEFEDKIWITKDNKKIKIRDISLEHLKNIIKYLEKEFDEIENPLNNYPDFNGEMAQMGAENNWKLQMECYERLQYKLKLFKTYYFLKTL